LKVGIKSTLPKTPGSNKANRTDMLLTCHLPVAYFIINVM